MSILQHDEPGRITRTDDVATTHRRGMLAGAFAFLALPRLARGSGRPVESIDPPTADADRLAKLADQLREALDREAIARGQEEAAWAEFEPYRKAKRECPAEVDERLEITHEALRVVEQERRVWYYDLLHAVVEEAGRDWIKAVEKYRYGKPFAVVRAGRRVYAVVAGVDGEHYDEDHPIEFFGGLGLCEVVVIDL